ncbi:class 1 fructose-bisphosphatase [Pseudothioclava arenosa]|uniref:Fructose-1,6-bisphosphatase class 1 n=1 Tax=Pseudothioclava arenosa TaxID=1795308 RepID=A0A2A4CNP9_9RHOB|nr:class 1 fructose-bisphosphatase [Pseudothioclava arenosa]PCD76861.1 class 1 fructose-bisphosphatase [Pseudothioclava arenosa]
MSLDLDGLGLAPDLADVMTRLAATGAELALRIARGSIEADLAASAGTNAGGDGQKALDVIADEAFMAALRGSAVAFYASEEQDDIVAMGTGTLALAIDPLDGSSNIDVNISIGTIFSIFPVAATPEANFLRPGHEQIAAGYILYGPQVMLVASFGQGVQQWVLDPVRREFVRIHDVRPLPLETSEFAINASNYRHWPAPVRAFIDDLVAGADGPRGRNFNMRWIASLVAETHRILTRGGVFLYPADKRKGYERGRLRLLYECAPIAMLITQAGGAATDGADPILGAVPDGLHARTGFVFGTAAKVARVAAYHDLPEDEASALFSTRGLFRS